MSPEKEESSQPISSEIVQNFKLKEPSFLLLRNSPNWKLLKARFLRIFYEYECLPVQDKAKDPEADRSIKTILANVKERRLELEDLCEFEALLINLLPPSQLEIKADSMIDYFRGLIKETTDDTWKNRIFKDWDKIDELEKRSRVSGFQSERARISIKQWAGEKLKTDAMEHSIVGVLLIVLILILLYNLFPIKDRTGALWLYIVAVSGAIGGFVSIFKRIYLMASFELGEAIYPVYPSVISVCLSPAIGALGAIVIYIAMHTGVFNFFSINFIYSNKYRHLVQIFYATPSCIADQSKLILLSMAAGFSERIVPDMLQHIVGQIKIQK